MKKIIMLASLFSVVGAINCQSEKDFLFDHPELEIQQLKAHRALEDSDVSQAVSEAVNTWYAIHSHKAILVNGLNLEQLRNQCLEMERQGNKNSQECALFHEWQERSKQLEEEGQKDLDRKRKLMLESPEGVAFKQLSEHIKSEAAKAK